MKFRKNFNDATLFGVWSSRGSGERLGHGAWLPGRASFGRSSTRNGLPCTSTASLSNRRDRAWKLDRNDRRLRFFPQETKLVEGSQGQIPDASGDGLTFAATRRGFLILRPRSGRTAISQVVEAAPNLECVRVGANTGYGGDPVTFFPWLGRQLDCVALHRNPERLRVFCFDAEYEQFQSEDR